MKLHDSNHLMAEAVTEQKVVITVMILILSSACNKKRDETGDAWTVHLIFQFLCGAFFRLPHSGVVSRKDFCSSSADIYL